MSLIGISNAVVRVQDLEASLRYYRDVLGLVEMGRLGDVVWLGCGGDGVADLGLAPGGAGLQSFAFRVREAGSLETVKAKLDGAGVAHKPIDEAPPGIAEGVAFTLPSGHRMEAVVAAEPARYLHPTQWNPDAAGAPLDLDHLNLHAADVEETARFLVDVLDFRISDVFDLGGQWFAAWCRTGEFHHDIAIAMNPATTLHHVSLLTQGIGQHERFADRLARFGYQIEWGIGRHGPGGNLFMYARDPSGNRVEFTAEMGRVPDPQTPTRFWSGDPLAMLNQWGVAPPPTFAEGT